MDPDKTIDPSLSQPRMISVEVAYATPQRQMIVKLEVPEGCTVEEAIEVSGLRAQFPAIEQSPVTGVFSHKVGLSYTLKSGDRVEIYRPLIADPKEVRREKAIVERKEPAPRKKGVRRHLQ